MSTALAAGTQVAALAAFAPQHKDYPVDIAVELHQRTTRRLDRYVPAAAMAALLSSLVLIRRGPSWASRAAAAGASGTVATAIAIGMPLDRRIATWSPAAPPKDAPAVFRLWNRVHVVRTGFAVVALLCSAVAAVADGKADR